MPRAAVRALLAALIALLVHACDSGSWKDLDVPRPPATPGPFSMPTPPMLEPPLMSEELFLDGLRRKAIPAIHEHRYIIPDYEADEHPVGWLRSIPRIYSPHAPHFTPAAHDVDRLEAMLPDLLRQHAKDWAWDPEYKPDVSTYVLVYTGGTDAGLPKIWLRAVHEDHFRSTPATPDRPAITLRDLRTLAIADGGCVMWRVTYDVVTGQIEHFACNGG
jgi:hypothetical protein